MSRPIFDDQFLEISTEIIQIGTLVETALDQAIQAIQNGDQALCGLVIASDSTIDDLRSEVERLTFQSLTLQQPLEGRDLRFLSSAPLITADLERTGDMATDIAKLLLRMAPLRARGTSQVQIDPAIVSNGGQKRPSEPALTEDSIVSGLLNLGQEAQRVLRGTMRAFEESDARTARIIWQEDDVVDDRYRLVHHDLMTMMEGIHAIPALQQDSSIMQRMAYWLWITHDLKRVGDHCTNICERIVFFVEGDTASNPR